MQRSHSSKPCFHPPRCWRTAVTMLLCAGAIAFCGCDDLADAWKHHTAKTILPAPVREDLPYTYQSNRLMRIYTADCSEPVVDGASHIILLEGVSAPNFGHPCFRDSKMHVVSMRRYKHEIEVIALDEHKREIVHLHSTDKDGNRINVAISLLENGFAWFDHSEGDYAEEYQAAEQRARDAKLGIWSDPDDPDPEPPWVRWEADVKERESIGRRESVDHESADHD